MLNHIEFERDGDQRASQDEANRPGYGYIGHEQAVSPQRTGRQGRRVHECESVLALLEQDVDGFMGAAVIEMSTGEPHARLNVQPEFGMWAVAQAARTAMKAHVEAEMAVGAGVVQEMSMSDSACFHFYMLLTPDELLVVSAQREETSLAMLRAMVRRIAAPLSARLQPSLRPS